MLERAHFAIDIGVQVSHGAVRAYVDGRARRAQRAGNPDDIAAMARIVREAVEAGARRVLHVADHRPPRHGRRAGPGHVRGGGRVVRARSARWPTAAAAVFELAPMGAAGEDIVGAEEELDWMCRLADEIGMPVSFALDAGRRRTRPLAGADGRVDPRHRRGAPVYPQVAGATVRHVARARRAAMLSAAGPPIARCSIVFPRGAGAELAQARRPCRDPRARKTSRRSQRCCSKVWAR